MAFNPTFKSPSSKYFTQEDLSFHCTPNSLWVSLFGQVFDLTELYEQCKENRAVQSLVKHAGGDLSHFFDQ